MSDRREWLLLAALLGMDLSWLYGWAALIMLAGFHQPLPHLATLGIAVSATLLTVSHHRRGWRIYQIGALHLAGLLLACGVLIYAVETPASSFFDRAWLAEFFTMSRTPLHWLRLAVTLCCCLALWITATRLALLPRSHATVSNHFDFGVIALVLLHLLEMLLFVEGGIILTGLSLPRLLLAFLAFTVPAFCLARCGTGQGTSGFISGFRGIGAVVSFLALVLLLGGGVIALFLPYLTVAAETGVAVLKTVTTPLGELLLRILRFLFGSGRLRSDAAGSGSAESAPLQHIAEQPVEGWLLLVQKILLFLTAGLGLLLALALCALLLWQLVWWLTKRGDTTAPGPSPWQLFRHLLRDLVGAVMALAGKLRGAGTPSRGPVQLYLSLMHWGAVSGLPLMPSETPREYGRRLMKRLPAVTDEIELIIAVHNASVYGGRTGQAVQLHHAWAACSRLRSPRFWPLRLKSLLFR
ncbi:DUF4129 domain-containing protein [Desulfocastanea catecholica]